MATAQALVDAFASHDARAYFEFFSDDASFIFYTHPEVLTSRRAWEDLWKQWETESGFRVHSCVSQDASVQMLGEDNAVFRHRVISSIEMEGHRETVSERETIVFSRRGSAWMAVHEHLSPLELSS